MRIKEVIWRNRNDFHWIGECEFCGHTTSYADGYAGQFYCQRVVPDRECPQCGARSTERASRTAGVDHG